MKLKINPLQSKVTGDCDICMGIASCNGSNSLPAPLLLLNTSFLNLTELEYFPRHWAIKDIDHLSLLYFQQQQRNNWRKFHCEFQVLLWVSTANSGGSKYEGRCAPLLNSWGQDAKCHPDFTNRFYWLCWTPQVKGAKVFMVGRNFKQLQSPSTDQSKLVSFQWHARAWGHLIPFVETLESPSITQRLLRGGKKKREKG